MTDIAPTPTARSCGDCAMCCKLLEIEALEKPAGEWCPNCPSRKGCSAYETRPDACRTFNCVYITQPAIGEEWRPTTSRMILTYSADGKHLVAIVDPTRRDAWRKAPYLQQLREWARLNNPRGQMILVSVNNHYTVIYPDREQELGHLANGQTVNL